MKNKQKNWNVNNQEDEDGFSLNPYDVFIFYSSSGNWDFSTIRNTTISKSSFAKLTMTSSEEKKFAKNVTHFQGQITTIRNKQIIAT